ncbi:hypothetical protein BDW75DRAFT_211353 [Aspergillus navahoensis]
MSVGNQVSNEKAAHPSLCFASSIVSHCLALIDLLLLRSFPLAWLSSLGFVRAACNLDSHISTAAQASNTTSPYILRNIRSSKAQITCSTCSH